MKAHNTKKTTGELSTGKQQCGDCRRWFENVSNHRKCNGRSRTASYTDVRDASQSQPSHRHSQIGTRGKYKLQQKALQPKEKILQVSDVLTK